MLLSTAAAGFVAHRKVFKKPNTIRNDKRTLRLLAKTTGDIQVSSVRPEHLDVYFQTRIDEEMATGTLNLEMSVLRQFFAYCTNYGYIRKSPMAHIHKLKDLGTARTWIPVRSFPLLLDTAGNPRNRAIVAVAIFLMLRSSEIQSLRIGDVDLAQGKIQVVVWKTSERDVMDISIELDEEMRTYLSWYGSKVDLTAPDAKNYYLFPRMGRPQIGFDREKRANVKISDGPLMPQRPVGSMFAILKPILQQAGYDEKNTAGHALRRSSARALWEALVEAGQSDALEVVQAMLHHKTPDITQLYIGATPFKRRRSAAIAGKAMFPEMAARPDATISELRARHG